MTDDHEIARIMELRAQGLNSEQIGKVLFFCGSAIRKKVRNAGLSEQYQMMAEKSSFKKNRDDIREMLESGAKYSEIMSRFGVSQSAVRKWCKALEIPPRPRGGGNSRHLDIKELIRLRESGKTYVEIGKIVGAAGQTVWANLVRAGVVKSGRGSPLRKFPDDPGELARLRILLSDGYTNYEIAKQYGIRPNTVSKWRSKMNIPGAGRGRKVKR